MPRITGSSNRKKAKKGFGILLLASAFVIGSAVGGLYIYDRMNKITVDSRNCRTDGAPRNVTAILIDATDTFTPRQRELILNSVIGLAEEMAQYDEIAIYSLKTQKNVVLEPELSVCKPQHPKDVDVLTQNAKKVRTQFEEQFSNKLGAILNVAVAGNEADTSPILEAMADIVVRAFQRQPAGSAKRLVVISDLLQNSGGINHYRSIPSIQQFQNLPNAYALLPQLNGVGVCFGYLDRPTARRSQSIAHTEFWVDVVRLAGGKVVPCPPLTSDRSFLMRLG